MTKPQDDIEHWHCPLGCEKPQPVEVEGEMLCMRCWCKDKVKTVCDLCVPGENCE